MNLVAYEMKIFCPKYFKLGRAAEMVSSIKGITIPENFRQVCWKTKSKRQKFIPFETDEKLLWTKPEIF